MLRTSNLLNDLIPNIKKKLFQCKWNEKVCWVFVMQTVFTSCLWDLSPDYLYWSNKHEKSTELNKDQLLQTNAKYCYKIRSLLLPGYVQHLKNPSQHMRIQYQHTQNLTKAIILAKINIFRLPTSWIFFIAMNNFSITSMRAFFQNT